MQESAHSALCIASRIAPAAGEWLSTSSSSRPYHIFERVCNLINAEGDVLTLMLAPAQMNPLVLEIDCQDYQLDLASTIQPSSEVAVSSNELFIGDLKIDLRQSTSWAPTPDWPQIRSNCAQLLKMRQVVLQALLPSISSESLAVFIEPSALESPIDGWQERARKPVRELLHWLRVGEFASAGDCAASLAGLGKGLTPGGDDFLIGVMYAVWSTLPETEAMSICPKLSEAAEQRTNQLSACSMKRATLGETSSTWQALLVAMAQADQETITRQVDALMRLGHTSGQDALTGFLLALLALNPHKPR
jgi:hypothetical protein